MTLNYPGIRADLLEMAERAETYRYQFQRRVTNGYARQSTTFDAALRSQTKRCNVFAAEIAGRERGQ